MAELIKTIGIGILAGFIYIGVGSLISQVLAGEFDKAITYVVGCGLFVVVCLCWYFGFSFPGF